MMINVHGANRESFRFDVDNNGNAYADISQERLDDPVRYYASGSSTPSCTAGEAAKLAASYFSPTCSIKPEEYEYYTSLELNSQGRSAYIFKSCAGPETRGRFSYMIVEKTIPCSQAGSFMTYDPYPVIATIPVGENVSLINGRVFDYGNSNYNDLKVINQSSILQEMIIKYNWDRGRY